MNQKITIGVGHRNITIRTGIIALLSVHGDFDVMEMLPGGADPRIAGVHVLDYESGIAAVDSANQAAHGAKVLVMTERVKEWDVRTALDRGIRGFLPQDCDAMELARAIRGVERGETYLSLPIATLAQRSLRRKRLTTREGEVLQLVGQGCCNKLIARKLGIAEITIKRHVQSLMQKLEATTRTHAVAIAMQIGLMETGHDSGALLAS